MWSPTSERDLQLAIAEGSLIESHTVEVKERSGSTDGERKETARDLASFAIDGGVIILGIAEDKAARQFRLAPQPLEQLTERMEQIATSRIDPPLNIRSREIYAGDGSDPTFGYVVIEISPSAEAPHMVDGAYFGRHEKSKYRLSDAEVSRLVRQRQVSSDRLEAELRRMEADDPAGELQRSGHLYLLATPVRAPRNLATELVRHPNNSVIFAIRNDNEKLVPSALRAWAPTTSTFNYDDRRARGAGFRSFEKPPTTGNFFEPGMVDGEVAEDGSIRIILGRLTDSQREVDVILHPLAFAWTTRMVLWARDVSIRTDYRGSWDFGILGTRLRGKVPFKDSDTWPSSRDSQYDLDEFSATTRADRSEIEEIPRQIAYRVMGGLLRGLGVDGQMREYLEPIA